jgi:broad specificity phosphatase PhoE
MGRILLVRHGQASLLDEDYDRLSPLGRVQAEVLGAWLGGRGREPQLVVSGTLRRQADTAGACVAAAGWRGVALAVDGGFDEYSHHELFARAYPELAAPAALAGHLRASADPRREFQALFERAFGRWLSGELAGEGGVTWHGFRQRCVVALDRVAAGLASGQRAVVVTSGGPIAAICQALLGLADEHVAALHMPLYNASISELLSRGADIALSTFNSVAHLEAHARGDELVTYR